ncbi:MAG: UDP-N-acetylmuramoyl-L-alanine--D-glutamate ligase [Candidatus Goldiibacteriota bacterium]|jgi:UDP-N-acetylmuramoylalanine--D-glutamate ligase
MIELEGKTVLIVGAGKSGVSAAKFLLGRGVKKIILSDTKPKSKLEAEALELEKKGVELETEGHRDASFLEADIIILSPGVPIQEKWREVAAKYNKLLVGDVEFASQFIDAKIVAITGTNGKTTATTLMYEIMKAQLGDKVRLAGNIGIPFCDILMESGKPEYIVIEISSFQLEAIKDFKPEVAVILNVTDDHLDRYRTMQEYAEAKANIFRNQGPGEHLILNMDDKFTNIMTSMARSTKHFFSAYRQVDNGYYFDGEDFIKSTGGIKEKLFSAGSIKLIGRHNYENVMACIMASDLLKLDRAGAIAVIQNFSGLHHRIEFIGEANGIKCYDDSKGTNVDAVLKALDTFDEGLALILGGREKGTDFTPILNALKPSVKAIIALGENREKIYSIFAQKLPVFQAASMEEAVGLGLKVPGIGVLLLSPACASFDLFKNYAHRGDEFKKYVLKAAA